MLKGFKDFALKGNLIEVAVGLVMALAIFALVQSLIESLITPLIAAIVGEPDFGALSFTINGSEFLYGDFISPQPRSGGTRRSGLPFRCHGGLRPALGERNRIEYASDRVQPCSAAPSPSSLSWAPA